MKQEKTVIPRACPEMLLFRAPARDLAQKIRCTLKNKGPLIAAKDNVEPIKASPRSGPCDLAWSSPALRPGMFFAGIATADAEYVKKIV
ncbi:hypothetical protein RJ60_04920 [Mesotoga sp. B105.6.4]|nr:hypothetical protein RJ60_04920 [Mesotoga sp. B105.6.4]RAO95382.1 hypothetical protein M388_15520 [Mesotoga sp. Brook.08.YT.4.2.5.4.]